MCSTNVVEYGKFTYFVSMLLRCEIFLSKPSLTKKYYISVPLEIMDTFLGSIQTFDL